MLLHRGCCTEGPDPPNMSLELTPTVAPKNRFARGVGFESMIEWGGERSSAPNRYASARRRQTMGSVLLWKGELTCPEIPRRLVMGSRL
jgi:hypothetical protein